LPAAADRGQCANPLLDHHISKYIMPAAVLARIGNGNRRAIKDCIDLYGSFVWSLARHLGKTPADADNATQQIFIEIWRDAPLYDVSKGSEAAFIANIARRCLIVRGHIGTEEPVVQPRDASGSTGAVFCQINAPTEVAAAIGDA